MEKRRVDKIITDYLQKLYGFAIKKSYSYEEAEELCSEIILEVYQSLLRAEGVVNLEGYIWRISEHSYAKYVSSKKKLEGVSIDGIDIPYEQDFFLDDTELDITRLRREIAFLSEIRRKTVFLFYYEKQSIAKIAAELKIPQGTVKWHLNKARKELKEGFTMERKIGKLGLNPIELTADDFGHAGRTGKNGGPEFYLQDKINLNIVYSVWHTPRTKEEIAEELGLTLVYIEDKINFLEANGFLVKIKGNKYTTYVRFNAEKYSLELKENVMKAQLKIAEELVKEYVPFVREAVADVKDVYIPGGNRELFEATAIFYGIVNKCNLYVDKDLAKYVIKTTDGGNYIAYAHTNCERSDPDYTSTIENSAYYWSCGEMIRGSGKYPAVESWSVDTKFCSRKGAWQNNLLSDYEYLYEFIKGELSDTPANAEKIQRLKDRKFISDCLTPNVMVAKGKMTSLFDKIPKLDEEIKNRFADMALEAAMLKAKNYPPQMQDLIVSEGVRGFIGNSVAIMVMDILYSNGTFKPLTKEEMITSNLIMFSDVLPE